MEKGITTQVSFANFIALALEFGQSLEGKGYYCIIQIKSSELGIAQDISQFYSDVRDNCMFETIAL